MRKVKCLIMAMAFISVRALAQSPSNATSDESQSANSGLEEVVVTAERHEANAQKVPITIQVLGADEVRSSGISGVTDLAKMTTGVEIGVGGSSTQIFIRGVGDFSFNPLANPGVAFNVDGVYIARPDGLAGNLYDVERIEVLKGPQGTLYGRNANGGSINVITREPLLGATGATLNLEVGDYQYRRVDGAVNVPLGESAALRAAFNVTDRDGYLSDGTNDDVQRAGRVRFRWQPSEDVSLIAGATTHTSAVTMAATPGCRGGRRRSVGGAGDPAAIAYRNSMPPLGPLLDPRVPDTRQDTTIWGVSGQLDWHLTAGTLTGAPRLSRLGYPVRAAIPASSMTSPIRSNRNPSRFASATAHPS